MVPPEGNAGQNVGPRQRAPRAGIAAWWRQQSARTQRYLGGGAALFVLLAATIGVSAYLVFGRGPALVGTWRSVASLGAGQSQGYTTLQFRSDQSATWYQWDGSASQLRYQLLSDSHVSVTNAATGIGSDYVYSLKGDNLVLDYLGQSQAYLRDGSAAYKQAINGSATANAQAADSSATADAQATATVMAEQQNYDASATADTNASATALAILALTPSATPTPSDTPLPTDTSVPTDTPVPTDTETPTPVPTWQAAVQRVTTVPATDKSGWSVVQFSLLIQNISQSLVKGGDFQNSASLQAAWQSYTYNGSVSVPGVYLPPGYTVLGTAQVEVPTGALPDVQYTLQSAAGAQSLSSSGPFAALPPLPRTPANNIAIGQPFAVQRDQSITIQPQQDVTTTYFGNNGVASDWLLHAHWQNLGGNNAQLNVTVQVMAPGTAAAVTYSSNSIAPMQEDDVVLQAPLLRRGANDLLVVDQNSGDYAIYRVKPSVPAETWAVTPQASGTGQGFTAVSFADAKRGWAVGTGGTIVHTDDGGATWTAQSSGTSVTLSGLAFHGRKSGWAVGEGGTILHTADGGATWTAQQGADSSNPKLEAVSFPDASHGWAVGTGGIIWHTDDGGANWTAQPSGSTNDLYGIFFHDAKNGWAVGANGTVLSTGDGGNNWGAWTSSTNQSLYAVRFIDNNTGWLTGGSGTLDESFNGGGSWTSLTSGTGADLRAIAVADAAHIWAVGVNGTALYSQDGGGTWSSLPSGTGAALFGAAFASANEGWAVGDNGTILHITRLARA